MQARRLRWLISGVSVLSLASCQRGQPVATEVSPVPSAQPFVFYDETGDPSGQTPALSEVELREIVDWVASQTNDPVWLIRVKPPLFGEKRGLVVAYLVPGETTPRIRTGRAYHVPSSKEQTGSRSPWEYAQVSIPDHTFSDGLTKPPVTELPFGWPTIVDPNSPKRSPMPMDEVIAIVDFVHEPSNYRGLTTPSGTSESDMALGILRSPIYDIRRKGNETTVRFGYMHGFLWGHGWSVTLERTFIGYRVLTWGWWIS